MGDVSVSTIAVGIVEDLDEIREGLADLLTSSAGFTCTGSWPTMEDALRALKTRRPEILLVDLGLPGMDGIEGIRRVREAWPAIVPVVLTVYHGLVYVGLGRTSAGPSTSGTLDGRTGEDVDVDLKIVPSIVGPGYAIGPDRLEKVTLYPAVG